MSSPSTKPWVLVATATKGPPRGGGAPGRAPTLAATTPASVLLQQRAYTESPWMLKRAKGSARTVGGGPGGSTGCGDRLINGMEN